MTIQFTLILSGFLLILLLGLLIWLIRIALKINLLRVPQKIDASIIYQQEINDKVAKAK